MSGSSSPSLGFSNITANPASTWAGAASILAVLGSSMSQGMPTTTAGWTSFGVSLLMGVASIFSKA
jgi:hypothetical protein